jgi:hypothetical protein
MDDQHRQELLCSSAAYATAKLAFAKRDRDRDRPAG